MSQNSDYKNLKELTKSLSNGIEKLESGNLDSKELTELLDDARTLHERIAVLQYLAFEKNVKKKEAKKQKPEPPKAQGSFELNFGTPEVVEEPAVDELKTEEEVENEIHPNQTSLLDAIEERVDVIEEVEIEEKPTEMISSSTSVNEKFANEASKKTLADKLSRQPISNLKEAIGINQKFLFMNDLFEGENTLFNEAVESLNTCQNIEDAMTFLKDNLASKYNWDKEHQSVINFIDLVERRFMA